MERKLASLEVIKSLRPIPGADNIEVATVKGWHCVVKKGDFKIGDWCIYFEVDSVLPELEPFEFLRKNCWIERYKGFRIKTVKLRGQVSQGLVMPLTIFLSLKRHIEPAYLEPGIDLTNTFNVQKYVPEIPSCLSGKVVAPFPTNIIPKTDEERVENLSDTLEQLHGTSIYITEKLDGSSCTFYLYDDHFGVCGRNWEWEEDNKNMNWEIARKYDIENKLRYYKLQTGCEIALQGEIIGPGIQKNKYNLDKVTVRFFTSHDLTKHQQDTFARLLSILRYLNLKPVPIVDKYSILEKDSDYWIEKSKGFSTLNSRIKREGIVVKTLENKTWPGLGIISFKAINPEYLLKYGE